MAPDSQLFADRKIPRSLKRRDRFWPRKKGQKTLIPCIIPLLPEKGSRSELNRLIDDARKRKVGAVLVWRFDRFARSTKHRELSGG